jgi:trans-aconitate methyltransferase
MDVWDEGDAYEDYMGRWSRPVAREFLDWLPFAESTRWLDVGCGTGALTGVIAEMAKPKHVSAIDPSPGFIAAALQRLGHAAEDSKISRAESTNRPDMISARHQLRRYLEFRTEP